ncbi:MAG: hypothetical protein ACRCX8_12670 [Sarcina sp.]
MGIIDSVKNKVNNEVDFLKEKQEMKNDGLKYLQYMRGLGSDAIYSATQMFVMDEMQDLGISSYESVNKIGGLTNSLTSMGNKVGVDLSGVQSVINTGMGYIDTATGILNSPGLFMNQVFKRNLGSIPPSSTDDTIGKKDPISNSVNLKQRVYNIIERCGYAQDKTLSISYSRNFIFTSRPTLASDSSGHYKSFVFFTRPNCNLVTINNAGLLGLVPELTNYDSMYSLVATDPSLYSELCRDGCGRSNLFRLLSNYVKEVPPVRLSETERSGIENMYGYSTPLAGVPEYHNVDVSLTFNDNYRGDIYKLLYAMSEYRHIVSKRGYAMRSEYVQNKADDSLMSMYVVTVTPDMEIVGFGVFLNGVIADVPTHATQHKADGFSKDELLDNFSVTMKFSTYYPYSPRYYDYFNNIFNFNPLDVVDVKANNYNMMAPGRTLDYETSGNSSRTTLFGSDFGIKIDKSISAINGIVDQVQGYVDQAGRYVDSAKGLLQYADTYNSVKNFLEKGKPVENAEIIESVKYQYPGQFEFLAKNPGVYVAASQNPLESGRIIFRLGFSY